MGCGASIFGRRDSKRQPLLSARRGLVTPPQGSERPGAKGAGLWIDTNLPSRKDVAVAETPVGKQAEEYKYYCPLCMMFFKQVLEMPCCKQSLCTFCLHEYVAKQQAKHQPSSNDAPGDALTVPTARRARGLATAAALLPEGMACPQCASKSKAPLHLKLLQNGEEASTRYVDSPRTRAEMDRVQQKQQKIAASLPGQPANSPIKAGDDFSALSRKMLPFSAMLVEEPDESNSVTPRFPDSADASAGAAPGSAAVASATAEGADSGAGRYDSAVTSATDRYDSGAGRITGDPTEAGGALAAGPPPGAHEAPAAVMDAPDAAVTARLAAGATGTEPTAPTA